MDRFVSKRKEQGRYALAWVGGCTCKGKKGEDTRRKEKPNQPPRARLPACLPACLPAIAPHFALFVCVALPHSGAVFLFIFF